MHKILRKKRLNSAICLIEIEAPQIAKKVLPGQFIILRIDERGERIPLTVYDFHKVKGSISIIFQEVGKTTLKLRTLKEGDGVIDLVGPLGNPTEIDNFGRVLCIGGGVGAAEIYPVARSLKAAGNEVVSIIGSKTKDLLILEGEMKKLSTHLYVTTDDGSYGFRGLVTDLLVELLKKERFDIVFAVGPVPMMKAVSDLTRQYNTKTIVSLNSIMVDGTGMCGSCRVTVGKAVKFTCVDGPDFDGHLVDFDELMARQARFLQLEEKSLKIFKYQFEETHIDVDCPTYANSGSKGEDQKL